jgi:hypothetical protein
MRSDFGSFYWQRTMMCNKCLHPRDSIFWG